MEIFVKTEAEEYPVTVDFVSRLPSGTTISSGAGSVLNTRSDEEENDILDSTTLSVTSTTAKGVVTGGVSGTDYKVSFQVTLSDSSVLEESLLMQVRAR